MFRLITNPIYLLFTLMTILFSSFLWGQKTTKPFIGSLTYRITVCDTTQAKFIPIRYMNVYTNDTLTRIENETDRLGKQIVIKHLVLNKSYLLLSTPKGNYAIQTNYGKQKKDSIPSYEFQKKWGSKKFCGIKAKKVRVLHKEYQTPMTSYYIEKYSPKYLNAFENFPGLPVLYFIPTPYGLLKYELVKICIEIPEHDLFGIPSDYKRTTFDDFLKEAIQAEEE
jgi:hypothetical protein